VSSSSTITKIYLLSDSATAWSVSLTEATVVRDVLTQIGKKLSINADKLELFACYYRADRETEQQDKMDASSTLLHVKEELQLARDAKFRWGLRVPVNAGIDASLLRSSDSAAAIAAVNAGSPVDTEVASTSPRSPRPSAAVPLAAAAVAAAAAAPSEPVRGFLMKKGDGLSGARWKRRWFVQEGDRLYYYNAPDSEPINYIDLHQVQAIPFEPPTSDRLTFDVATPSRVYKLKAETSEERTRWVSAVNGVLSRHLQAAQMRATLTTKRSLVPVKDETLRLARRDTSNVASPDKFQSPTLPPKKPTMIGAKLPAAEPVAAKTPPLPARNMPPKPVDLPTAFGPTAGAAAEPALARESINRLSMLLDMMMDADAKRDCEVALSSVATVSLSHIETIKHLQTELLESQIQIARLEEAAVAAARAAPAAPAAAASADDLQPEDVEARSRQARFSIRKTDARLADRDYVERLEKAFMDQREELEDLRSVVHQIIGVKQALSAVLAPDENENA
jgi:hypothetical protein